MKAFPRRRFQMNFNITVQGSWEEEKIEARSIAWHKVSMWDVCKNTYVCYLINRCEMNRFSVAVFLHKLWHISHYWLFIRFVNIDICKYFTHFVESQFRSNILLRVSTDRADNSNYHRIGKTDLPAAVRYICSYSGKTALLPSMPEGCWKLHWQKTISNTDNAAWFAASYLTTVTGV
jgi:hypothetical protein